VRLFLAINLPAEARHAIAAEAAAPLQTIAPQLSWVREPKLHLTVKFLGEQPPDIVPALTEALGVVGERNKVIEVEIGGVGAFPNFRRPRVVWIGVTPDPKLELLHHDVEAACEAVGLPLDAKPFRPHVTLARVKPRAADSITLRRLAQAADQVSYVEEVLITSVDLMVSELTSTGARHTVLSSVPLRYQ
jgi:2'-5' RNA ligase